MRIVIFGTWPAMLFKFHGALIEALVRRGHEVHLAATGLTSDTEYAPKLRSLGAKLHDVSVSRTGLNPAVDLRTFVQALRLFRRVRPDLALAYTIKPVIYGTLAAFASRVRSRFALIVGLGYSFTEAQDAAAKRGAVRLLVSGLYRLALGRATHVLFQNSDDEKVFIEAGIVPPRIPSGVVDGCGVDLDAFPQLPLPPTPVFLFVGRLLVDKGVREFVAAARMTRKSVPDARFLILGGLDENPSGITRAEVEGWVGEGIVEWLGYCDDIRDSMTSASVFVLPSYREGLPQSGIEALASGRAVISCDVPGCREIVENGTNGFLVPARDANSLAQAMIVLSGDGPLRARMGNESRALAERRFSADLISRFLIDKFERAHGVAS